jgi:hypothetical protein
VNNQCVCLLEALSLFPTTQVAQFNCYMSGIKMNPKILSGLSAIRRGNGTLYAGKGF